jgi:hypothetical protein
MAMIEDIDNRIFSELIDAARYESNAAERKEALAVEMLRPFMLLKPKLSADGNMWCFLYGDNLVDGVAGFGETPAKAAVQFDIEWLNARCGKV